MFSRFFWSIPRQKDTDPVQMTFTSMDRTCMKNTRNLNMDLVKTYICHPKDDYFLLAP